MTGVDVVAILLILGNCVLVSAQECTQVDPRNISCACLFGGLEIVSVANVTVRDVNCNGMQNKYEFQKMPQIYTIMYLKLLFEEVKGDVHYVQVSMPRAKCSKTYVLFMLDPDVPGYQPGNFHNHPILSKIPGNKLQDRLLKNVTTTLCYREPDPPSTTGIHRYIFLVYEQQNPSVNLKAVPEDRRGNWSLADYVSCQETKLRGPVAGTQFRTRA